MTSRRERRTLQVWFILILIAAGTGMTAAILIQNILAVLIAWAMVAFDLYWFYTRHHKKIKPKYPMAPPDAEPVDAYFPRTNIPRPIHADAIKIHEKQRKLQQIKKMRKKKDRA